MIEIIKSAVIGWAVSNILNRFFYKSRTTSQIIVAYETRLREKDWSIAELQREQLDQTNEKHRIVTALKRSALSTGKIIDKYDRPLNAVLISYASQKEETSRGRLTESHFIRPELERFNVKYLGGTDSLIPPANVPKNIKNNKDLEEWFESEILKGRYCKLKFLVLVDLRKKAYWYSNLPYAQTRTSHYSIGEVLNIEDLFTEEQISKIALSDFVRNGDIAWLIADYLSPNELDPHFPYQTGLIGIFLW